MAPSLSPGPFLLAGIVVLFFVYVRWNAAHQRKRALERLDDDPGFAPGNETALARALGLLAHEREGVDSATRRKIDDLLRRQRPKVMRLLEDYWAIVAKSKEGEEPSPAEVAGSEFFTEATRAYGSDPGFRRDVVGRLRGATEEPLWSEILLEATCSEPFVQDSASFDDVLSAYAALPPTGPIRQSSFVASMVVEWAHESKRIEAIGPLRAEFEKARESAPSDEKDAWEDVLNDLDAPLEEAHGPLKAPTTRGSSDS